VRDALLSGWQCPGGTVAMLAEAIATVEVRISSALP